ncbi:methionyl-tRNA formyltransferase [Rhodococcoides trifolii]|uniref:Methionyl-tRNA formyltransferase n=1 Tax=Rhodococcoides trifolii TaxID=908250 RepID=A0A917D599_9NOCA|nr:methionyl-tRNA formyltransferase [Rhodococcus trifolii]GGG09323.1 methionyl-tRNA formyltransferase [Rhodococcus trifolii]
MRIVFAGTPDPALPSLAALIASPRHDVVAVVTRPDTVAGRGRKASRSPVALLADEHAIPVLTPATASDPEFLAALTDLAPDCCPVVAYGSLLPRSILDVPRFGWVNLHFSLLPAWRGAAPVQAAIAAGDELTGASTFLLEQGMDTGPVFGVMTERIRPDDTTGSLLSRLAEGGATLLESTLDGIADGTVTAVPQSTDGVSAAPKVTTESAHVDWSAPAHAVDRLIRSVTPAPGAWTEIGDTRIKLGPVTIVDEALPVGAVDVRRKAVLIGTASSAVQLGTVQPPGKKPMVASDWARGARLGESVTAR